MSTTEHHEAARGKRAVCAVLTISDTRTEATDTSGRLIRDVLQQHGHRVLHYAIVPDDAPAIDAQLRNWLADPQLQLICTTGGTGIANRDTTVEVVQRLLDKPLDGFGELFRMLSYEQVGPAAMLSRAVAGLADEAFIFAMPGSSKAVDLAMQKLILPELAHLLWERAR